MAYNVKEKNPSWIDGRSVPGRCIECDKSLKNPQALRCKSCNGKYNNPMAGKKGEANPNYRHGDKAFCITCNKIINFGYLRCHVCAAKYFLNQPDFKKSLKIRLTGKGNPMWKGGISFVPYPLGWNKTFKEQIRYRDGYRCALCGKPEIENIRKLSVHHKDYNKNNIQPENLISLCDVCHGKTTVCRAYWQEVFSHRLF